MERNFTNCLPLCPSPSFLSGLTPAMGWNSWNHFGCNVSEKLLRDTADAIVKLGLNKVGYEYVNVDDCWQIGKRVFKFEDG